ncbi:hypothetical protein Tsp_09649, partial [Trichinella spiralis]|uniref:hypothetical protein n=1 Tax=Trichinella spiralis TaxID=6334 RepID=UPI0001EFF057
RYANFFRLTREQPLHQCECAVEFRYNIRLGILNFYPSRSYGLYEFDIAEDDSSTSLTRISGRFPNNGHPAAYQFTAIGQQVTSCYNIGNGPRPSRTPLALGFWYSTHCSCIPFEFVI